jgi:hypothetical protein
MQNSFFTEQVLEQLKTIKDINSAKTLLRDAVEVSTARTSNKTKALVAIDAAKNITVLQLIAYNFHLSNGGNKVLR